MKVRFCTMPRNPLSFNKSYNFHMAGVQNQICFTINSRVNTLAQNTSLNTTLTSIPQQQFYSLDRYCSNISQQQTTNAKPMKNHKKTIRGSIKPTPMLSQWV